MTHGRLAQPETLAGARDVAFLHHGIEDNQQIEINCAEFNAGCRHASLRSNSGSTYTDE